jgi:phosphatidylcholine synthase
MITPNMDFDSDRLRAFAVHILTASGAGLAVLALLAAQHGSWPAMFLWLGLALIVDGADGPLARRLDVHEQVPRWSGEVLDLVVDFTTYAFVPAFAIAASGLLPAGIDIALGVLIAVTSALYFADSHMKLPENYFRGFPALWNAAAFYLFVIKPQPWIGALAIAILLVLTFLPFPFVHPLRVERLRSLNVGLLMLWALLAIGALLQSLDPALPITLALCAIAIYFCAVPFLPVPRDPFG